MANVSQIGKIADALLDLTLYKSNQDPPLQTMAVRILCIGLGGLGVISSYTLLRNDDVEITAVIRSDYDVVQLKGYTIDSVDYKKDLGTITYKPKHVVKSLLELPESAFDYIIVATKVIPQPKNNIWDEVEQYEKNIINSSTSIVLLQNGIDIEKYWKYPNLISGVSYISSTNSKGHVTQYGIDNVKFGYFDQRSENIQSLELFVSLYSNNYNKADIDTNVKLSRWKKLLYNSSYNTVCCLVDLDVGKLYEQEETTKPLVDLLMKEIQYVGNLDLKKNNSSDLITQKNIELIEQKTKEIDASTNYQPSMLVDYRNGRQIELEIIVGNVLNIYKGLSDDSTKVLNLTFLYHLLKLVQYKIKINQA